MDNFFIDTHCHLQMDEFKEEYAHILSQCVKNNIGIICNIGYDLQSSEQLINIETESIRNYNFCGIHPHYSENINEEDYEKLILLIDSGRFTGIGEIGIDRYWHKDESAIEKQKKVFIKQLEIAIERKMPITLHIRDAYNEAFEILKQYNYKKINFHSFTGNREQLEYIFQQDYFFSINGVITFKNSKLKDVVKEEYFSKMLLETDAPYLAPVPKRGKRNKPYYIKYIYEFICDYYNIDISELQKIVINNFKDFIKKNET